jgi:hypothetical protein
VNTNDSLERNLVVLCSHRVRSHGGGRAHRPKPKDSALSITFRKPISKSLVRFDRSNGIRHALSCEGRPRSIVAEDRRWWRMKHKTHSRSLEHTKTRVAPLLVVAPRLFSVSVSVWFT